MLLHMAYPIVEGHQNQWYQNKFVVTGTTLVGSRYLQVLVPVTYTVLVLNGHRHVKTTTSILVPATPSKSSSPYLKNSILDSY